MIRAEYLTEDQWFALCLRVFKFLREQDRWRALEALEQIGFDDENLQEG